MLIGFVIAYLIVSLGVGFYAATRSTPPATTSPPVARYR